MSSILRALKRLEKERPDKAYPRIWVRNQNSAHGLRQWLGVLLVVVLMAAVGGAALYRLGVPDNAKDFGPVTRQVQKTPRSASNSGKAQSLAPVSPPALTPQVKKSVTRANPQTNTGTLVSEPQDRRSIEQKRASVPDNAPLRRQRAPVGGQTFKVSAPVEPQPVPSPPPPKKSADRPRQSSPRLAAIPPETAVTVTPESDAPVSATIDAPALPANLLTGTSLKIQAISWSQVPQDRIAVVSSQVVREGQIIEGYRVKRINTEDLILSKEGLDWVLEFEHR